MFYVYVYLDASKPGTYKYGEYEFDHEPFYVGKGKKHRDISHLNQTNNTIKKNKKPKGIFKCKLYSMIKEENIPIITRVIDNIDEKTAFEIEKDLISKIGKKINQNGTLTNICDGGEGSTGHTMPDHQKEIIRKVNTGVPRPKDEEHRRKLSEATKKYYAEHPEALEHLRQIQTGKKWTLEQKKNRSKKYTGKGNPFKGKTHTKEIKNHLADKSRKYDWYLIENGNEIYIGSLDDYCLKHNLPSKNIRNAEYKNKEFNGLKFIKRKRS
jgi:hypothetical protein